MEDIDANLVKIMKKMIISVLKFHFYCYFKQMKGIKSRKDIIFADLICAQNDLIRPEISFFMCIFFCTYS